MENLSCYWVLFQREERWLDRKCLGINDSGAWHAISDPFVRPGQIKTARRAPIYEATFEKKTWEINLHSSNGQNCLWDSQMIIVGLIQSREMIDSKGVKFFPFRCPKMYLFKPLILFSKHVLLNWRWTQNYAPFRSVKPCYLPTFIRPLTERNLTSWLGRLLETTRKGPIA